jgi:hypothetical protein
VKSIRTKTSTTRLLFSEVELQVRGCLKGECPATVKVLVPGGRSGHIEQVVMGRPVPTKGTLLGVTLQRAPSGDTAPPSATSLYQLDQADEFQAFAEGVSDAGLALSKLTPEPVAER